MAEKKKEPAVPSDDARNDPGPPRPEDDPNYVAGEQDEES